MRTPDPKILEEATLLLTHGGSILYGLNHVNSDEDFYRVVKDEFYWEAIGAAPSGNRRRMARQTIRGDRDEMTVAFGTFAQFAFDGAPQALESMFSQMATIDHLEEFRTSYYASTGPDSMRENYRRTIHRFCYGTFKQRRHALRLSINLNQAQESGGKFNPTMTPEDAAYITAMAGSSPEQFIEALEGLNHYEISDDYNMDEIRQRFAEDNM